MKIFKNILVTNDDGYYAPGLKILKQILKKFSENVYVVAPTKNKSGSARSISLGKKIKFQKLSNYDWIVDGTPTDSMIFALNHIFKSSKPDFVFSGINDGSNIGDEISYSGTVGAAFESALRGIPSASLSQDNYGKEKTDFTIAKDKLPFILKKLKQKKICGFFYNINFPNCELVNVKDIIYTKASHQKLSDEVNVNKSKNYFEIGKMITNSNNCLNDDIDALKENYITFTPISINLTYLKKKIQ